MALESYDTHMGPYHPATLQVLRERALILVHEKRFKEALHSLQSLAARQSKVTSSSNVFIVILC